VSAVRAQILTNKSPVVDETRAERVANLHALCIDILGLPAYPIPRISKCNQ
jgi:hypothetical protein